MDTTTKWVTGLELCQILICAQSPWDRVIKHRRYRVEGIHCLSKRRFFNVNSIWGAIVVATLISVYCWSSILTIKQTCKGYRWYSERGSRGLHRGRRSLSGE